MWCLCKLESENPARSVNDINFIKNGLERSHLVRYRGAVVRAHADRYLFEEPPTQRALTDEKRYAKAKKVKESICCTLLGADPDGIKLAFVDYCKYLFRNRMQVRQFYRKEYVGYWCVCRA